MSFTVLTAEFQHESNTFSRVATGLEEFRARYFLEGEAALRERGDANTPLAGFLDVARPQGWRVIHPLSAGATPAGPVTRKAYETLVEIIVGAAWREVGRIDGVLLGLHGAMVTEHLEDGEGELLSRLRAALGPEVPIAITLDPHANVTKAMTREAQIIVGYKTYPHVDMRACGAHAASVLDRAMKGEIRPITVRACAPMLEEATGGRTDVGPMVERIARARAYETEPDVFVVSVNGGFGLADIREVGPTVLVTCQGDHKRHRAFARSLAQDMWERRLETVTHFLTVEEAAARAQTFEATHGPLVIADYADNPGGGGYGDSTTLLAALLAAGVKDAALGGLVDPQAVAELSRARRGDVVRLAIGGKTDPLIGGGPLAVEGEVMAVSSGDYVGDGPMVGGLKGSFGPTSVLRVAGIDVLLISNAAQLLDLGQFRGFGIEPTRKRVVAVKSMQHFRAAFEPVAGEVIVCDGGGLCTPDLSRLAYVRARRPIFPLDRDMP